MIDELIKINYEELVKITVNTLECIMIFINLVI